MALIFIFKTELDHNLCRRKLLQSNYITLISYNKEYLKWPKSNTVSYSLKG